VKRARLLYITTLFLFALGYRHFDMSGFLRKIRGIQYSGDVFLIEKDAVFKKNDSPIIISDYIVIKENATLTVEPGTSIVFDEKIGIVCYGRIVADGAESEIKISLKDGADMPWTNIILIGEKGSIFNNCNISGAGGVRYDYPSPPGLHREDVVELKPKEEVNTNLLGGGAIICYNSSPVIKNSTFINNRAPGHGGAIAILKNSSPKIINNRFISNYASFHGGALYSFNSSPILTNNSFRDSRSGYKGGAVYLQGTSIYLENNTFTNNRSQLGGALFFADGRVNFKRSSFVSNYSDAGGGVMGMNSVMTFEKTIIKDNNASFSGGAVYLSGSQAFFENCSVLGNISHSGGGIFCVKSHAEIKESNFEKNEPNNIEGCDT